MPSLPSAGSPAKQPPKRPPSHTVYIDDELWDRIVEVAFRSRPRRSASDVIRDMIVRGAMAIGVSDQLRVHTHWVRPSAGAQVLLCTDGLHGVAEEEELRAILSSNISLEAKCQDMIAAARNHGGPDNITAVLLKAV